MGLARACTGPGLSKVGHGSHSFLGDRHALEVVDEEWQRGAANHCTHQRSWIPVHPEVGQALEEQAPPQAVLGISALLATVAACHGTVRLQFDTVQYILERFWGGGSNIACGSLFIEATTQRLTAAA